MIAERMLPCVPKDNYERVSPKEAGMASVVAMRQGSIFNPAKSRNETFLRGVRRPRT